VQVVDVGVGPWKEQALVPRVGPADSERRLSIGARFENLRVTLWFPNLVRPDHDPITHFSSHDPPPKTLVFSDDHLAVLRADVGPNVTVARKTGHRPGRSMRRHRRDVTSDPVVRSRRGRTMKWEDEAPAGLASPAPSLPQ
jgi:hypothetical protein